jgi:hypothetical protein
VPKHISTFDAGNIFRFLVGDYQALFFNTMKILVIRFSSIGDIVLTTPIVRCLKQQLPHAQIHFLTKLNTN